MSRRRCLGMMIDICLGIFVQTRKHGGTTCGHCFDRHLLAIANFLTTRTYGNGFPSECESDRKILKERFTSTRGGCPLRRAGTPEDIAHFSAFLASKDVTFVTGTILAVDGGMLVMQK
ncbi:hypothetical protein ACTXT7_001239 [Hymenolepis weldensis]